jgi:hypothetical protein
MQAHRAFMPPARGFNPGETRREILRRHQHRRAEALPYAMQAPSGFAALAQQAFMLSARGFNPEAFNPGEPRCESSPVRRAEALP